jgi:hypothetical protein
MNKEIFVFGSNLAGRHGAGSAKEAVEKYGAIYGKGVGRQGDSYAIPTKDILLRSLTLKEIKYFVDIFLKYARESPRLVFNVVNIGCGLAGYTPEQIAPMFKNAPSNVRLSKEFNKVLNIESDVRKYSYILVKEGELTKKHRDYCLSMIDEFAPELEEFINKVIEEAREDGYALGGGYNKYGDSH